MYIVIEILKNMEGKALSTCLYGWLIEVFLHPIKEWVVVQGERIYCTGLFMFATTTIGYNMH